MLALGDYLDAKCHACIGGTLVAADKLKLQETTHVVVGTPGRVFDMINRKALCKFIVSVTIFSNKNTLLVPAPNMKKWHFWKLFVLDSIFYAIHHT